MATYLDIAINDYQYYKGSISANLKFNGVIIQGQQFIEKSLKAILEFYGHDKDCDDFRTHNIKKLVRAVSEYITVDNASDIKLADGYYFDMRYPGENYLSPTDEDFKDIDIAVNATVVLLQKELYKHKPLLASACDMIW